MRTLALAAAAACLAGLGCAGTGGPGWRWDPDSEVLPLKEPASPATEPLLRSLVILLPGTDGDSGAVDIVGATGSATLTRAGEAVALDDLDRIFEATDEEIVDAYRPAFDAEPEAPKGYTLYFRSGGTSLADESEVAWAGILSELAARSVPEVTIVAHADRAGDQDSNLDLSKQRAEAIRNALVRAGLDADLMETLWHGEERPVVPTEDGVPELMNRRVEIRVR